MTRLFARAVFVLLPAFPAGLPGQSFLFGLKTGVPLTSAFDGSFGVRSEAKRYTIGPMAEIGFRPSLAVEVNALYRRTGYRSSGQAFGIASISQARANSWEFPILAKRYFRSRRLFVSGGYAVWRLSGVEITAHSFGTDPIGQPVDRTSRLSDPPFFLRDNPTHGLAVGGGGVLKIGPLRAAPEFRYTRWGGRPIDEQGSRGFFVQSKQNQADLLLGLIF